MEERRDKRNIVYFIISYVINNLASGVLYDTFVNYLHKLLSQHPFGPFMDMPHS